jgi:hypothetical protein
MTPTPIELEIPWLKQKDMSTLIVLELNDDADHMLMLSDRMDVCYAWMSVEQLKTFHDLLGKYIEQATSEQVSK